MLHEISFRSTNARDSVQAWIYVPAAKPQGVIQLVHGFGEHSRRYLHMIVKFMEAGFIVAANDHVGHGKTALVNNCWGDWGDKGPHTMMEDEHVFMTGVKQMFPDLPYFMFGHSMGSMIARDFMAKYGDELDGVTLCGTPGEFPGLDESITYLKKLVDDGKGLSSDPEAGNLVMGWMFGRCEEGVKLGNEWICHDTYVQQDHADDPFDAFTKPTSNRSFLDFCYMIEQVTGPKWAEKVPADLPVYNIGGDQDPVGQYGEGVYKVSNWLIDNGNDVITELYTGYRHEIHNYAELKDEVEDGIVDFFEGCIGLPDDLLELMIEDELDEEEETVEPGYTVEEVDVEGTSAEKNAPEAEGDAPASEDAPETDKKPVQASEPAETQPVAEASVEGSKPGIPGAPAVAAAGLAAVAAEAAPVTEEPAVILPETQEAPVGPEVPAAVVAPEAPAGPSFEMPELPKMPDAPSASGAPAAPVESVAPEIPAAPVAPEIPAAPTAPVAPEIPAAPKAPVAPVAPEIPAAPTAPVAPNVSVAPEFKMPEMPPAPDIPAITGFKMPEMNVSDVPPGVTGKVGELEAQINSIGGEAAATVENIEDATKPKESIFKNFFHKE